METQVKQVVRQVKNANVYGSNVSLASHKNTVSTLSSAFRQTAGVCA